MDFGKTQPSPTTADSRFLHEIESLSQAVYVRRPSSAGRRPRQRRRRCRCRRRSGPHNPNKLGESFSYSYGVYGSRSGPHHSIMYEAKLFLLYVSVAGDADLGRHRVDLTCLLKELEDEKSTGRWTTSFRLSGKAKGAFLNASFSFVVVGAAEKGFQSAASAADRGGRDVGVRRVGTATLRGGSRSMDEVRILHGVLPPSRSEVESSMADLPARGLAAGL